MVAGRPLGVVVVRATVKGGGRVFVGFGAGVLDSVQVRRPEWIRGEAVVFVRGVGTERWRVRRCREG